MYSIKNEKLFFLILKINYYISFLDNKICRDLLKTATLYKLYNKLEHELKFNPEVATCNERCSAKLIGDSNEGSRLHNLCKGICNIILKVLNNNGFCNGSSCSGSFIYMNIWLYEHVKKIEAQDYEINKFYMILDSIMKTDASALNQCYITNYNHYNKDFLDMKYLCEFLDIYYDIKDKISEKYNSNDQLYCKHIKNFFQYYNKIKVKCNSTPKPIFCSMISKIKTSVFNSEHIKSTYDKCKYEPTSCNNNILVTDDLPCLKKKEISTIPEGNGDIKNILKIIYTASLSVFPVFVLLLILYKVNMYFFGKYK
ncbi:hypothetical protein PVNG_06189 [Plasmodium vivax North Korean]|uniref:Variable surface protein n=1 Tax=Plasmodium vivax North Korean TaxID=1035514 RepID=A0A0J9TM80_PLAVI|nr:hypothetical protein PVNG_06189 [Plasmodium vivax North Korean]